MGLTRWEEVRFRVEGFPCAAELLGQDVGWVEGSLRLKYGRDGRVGGGEEWRVYDGGTGRFD